MLITSPLTLFDCAEQGIAKVLLNISDCFGNVSCNMNSMFRVKYPVSYAADRRTIKGDRHKLGTVSFVVDNECLVINSYICYDFTDQLSIINGSLFDPTMVFSCLYQIGDILADYGMPPLYMSMASFAKFNIPPQSLISLLQYVSSNLPYDLVLTV